MNYDDSTDNTLQYQYKNTFLKLLIQNIKYENNYLYHYSTWMSSIIAIQ